MHGALLIHKPQGCSSYDTVRAFKHHNRNLIKTSQLKIGHAGTLDPFAQGLLILLIGNATRCMDLFLSQPKRYRAVLQFGIETDSADITGKPVSTTTLTPNHITTAHFNEVVKPLLESTYWQKPPSYSATKVNGSPSYQLARKGILVNHEAKARKIFSLELRSFTGADLTFDAQVSSGTYIRTLGEDLARLFNSKGYLTQLTRTQIADFELDQAFLGDMVPLPHILDQAPRSWIPWGDLASHLLPEHYIEWSSILPFCQGNQSALATLPTFSQPKTALVSFHPQTGKKHWIGVIASDASQIRFDKVFFQPNSP